MFLIVIDKPHRLPSMAHESNAVEHCGGCAERGLGLPNATLKVTHRLDSSTSGVLVLGKTESAVREFNESVAKKPGSKVRVSFLMSPSTMLAVGPFLPPSTLLWSSKIQNLNSTKRIEEAPCSSVATAI